VMMRVLSPIVRSSSHPARCRDPAAGERAIGAARNGDGFTRPLKSRHALQSLVDRSARPNPA
jgi:hypothetical protein